MPSGWPSSPISSWRWETSSGACSSGAMLRAASSVRRSEQPPCLRLAMEYQSSAESDQSKACSLHPAQGLVEIDRGEAREHDQSNHLLDRLELSRRINRAADPVGGHRETIFHEGDAPAHQHHATSDTALNLRWPYH